MRKLVVAVSLLVTSCSASQKAEEKAMLTCLGTEDVLLLQALQSGNAAALAADVWQCAQQAAAARARAVAGSGSAK
jgi:hypothetical protein